MLEPGSILIPRSAVEFGDPLPDHFPRPCRIMGIRRCFPRILHSMRHHPHLTRRIMITVAAAVFLLAPAHLSAQAQDAGEDIRGPKALVEIAQPKPPPVALWLGIGGGLLLSAIAVILWRKHRRRRRLKSPAEIALWSLAELESKREVMAAEAFANRAAQSVRQYIADCFGLAAPRRTTEEFLRDLAKEEGLSIMGEGDHLRVFLKSCDMAKFAASPLDAGQRGELIRAARGFIAATMAQTSRPQPHGTPHNSRSIRMTAAPPSNTKSDVPAP